MEASLLIRNNDQNLNLDEKFKILDEWKKPGKIRTSE